VRDATEAAENAVAIASAPRSAATTFITLVIEDGAKPEIIRDRVTHTKAARDAFSGYIAARTGSRPVAVDALISLHRTS
jgi:hypothetical protein